MRRESDGLLNIGAGEVTEPRYAHICACWTNQPVALAGQMDFFARWIEWSSGVLIPSGSLLLPTASAVRPQSAFALQD